MPDEQNPSQLKQDDFDPDQPTSNVALDLDSPLPADEKPVEVNKIPPAPPAKELELPHQDIPRLRTYADDVKNVIQTQKTSVTDIALAEQRRQDSAAQEERLSARNPKNIVAISIGAVLIVLSIGVIGYAIFAFTKNSSVPTITMEQKSPLMEYDKEASLDLSVSRRDIEGQLTAIGSDAVEGITYLAIDGGSSTTTPESVFRAFRFQASESLIRSLTAPYFFGVHKQNGEASPFLIIKVDSFENGFAGMLAWEKGMAYDFENVFFTRPAPVPPPAAATSTAATSTATTTASTTIPVPPRTDMGFSDQVIQNTDARIYRDADGKTLFFYTFLDRNTIFISDSTAALSEITKRITQAQLIR